MADRKIQIKQKTGTNRYTALNLATHSDLTQRDTYNIPVAGSNGTQVIQNMANLFFPVWGGTWSEDLLAKYLGTFQQGGDLVLCQAGGSPNIMVAIRSGTGYGFLSSMDGGENWLKWDDSQAASVLNRAVYGSLSLDYFGQSTLTVLLKDSDGSTRTGRLVRVDINPLGRPTYRSSQPALPTPLASGRNYSVLCDTLEYTLMFNDANGNYVGIEHASSGMNQATVTSMNEGIKAALFSYKTGRTYAIGTTKYMVSAVSGVTGWTVSQIASETLKDIAEDSLGNVYILGTNYIHVISNTDPLTISDTIPVPPNTGTGNFWSNIIVNNHTIMLMTYLGNVAILPISQEKFAKWRLIDTPQSAGSEGLKYKHFLRPCGNKILHGSYLSGQSTSSWSYRTVDYTYTNSPMGR